MTWVEYHGGPWDAAMVDKREPFDFEVVYRPREELPDGRYRVGPARGIYRREGPVIEGLDLIRMQWYEGAPDDLRPLEGRILGQTRSSPQEPS